jgi:predicted metal-dependent hydrolase
MFSKGETGEVNGIIFSVIYSSRRSIGISVRPDTSVIIRVPFRTPDKTIRRIVEEKSPWIVKHRDYYRSRAVNLQKQTYSDGEKHLFRGNYSVLSIRQSDKAFCRFCGENIEMGLPAASGNEAVKTLLYKGYKVEASKVFPDLMRKVLDRHENQKFRPTALIIRTMKRRWGSCSSKGVITLNTELIKLPDLFIEYVITHELCHLRHHNHGAGFYELLGELFPEWKEVRKQLRSVIIS